MSTTQWDAVAAALEKHFRNPDIEAARVLCSIVASHALKEYPPAWGLAIAPSGSLKTELLKSLRGLPRVHFVDEITPRTFISGKMDDPRRKKRTQPASLLHRIGPDGILVAADFSTFTANQKTFGMILSQLRRIYDGHLTREFGTDENLQERSWEGRLTVIAGAVPDIDGYHSLFQSLGERFVRVRWDRAGGVETGLQAMRYTCAVEAEIRFVIHALLNPILSASQSAPSIPAGFEKRIASLSEFVALSRMYVERDRQTREATGTPAPEGNTRLPQELCQIARGSALIDGRAEVNEDDYRLVCRSALNSLPPARCTVLQALGKSKSPLSTGLPKTTVVRALEDLQLAGILDSKQSLTSSAETLLQDARLDAKFNAINGDLVPATSPHELQKSSYSSTLSDLRVPGCSEIPLAEFAPVED